MNVDQGQDRSLLNEEEMAQDGIWPLYTVASTRSFEQQAQHRLGDQGPMRLMAQAGAVAWEVLRRRWPQARRLVVVCGHGNNGGDGYVLARHAVAAGLQVTVLSLNPEMPFRTSSAWAYQAYQASASPSEAFCPTRLRTADVIVDALLGIGLNRPVTGACRSAIQAMNASGHPILALDVPSGIAADTGLVLGTAIRANCTVQFLCAHQGLYHHEALDYVGTRYLAPLMRSALVAAHARPSAHAYFATLRQSLLGKRPRQSHKGHYGFVACVGGCPGHGGAILLTTMAVLRTGAGRVAVGTCSQHMTPILTRCPEAMVHAVTSADQLQSILMKASVCAIGPGLGQDTWGQTLWQAVLAVDQPLVVDADALNLLATSPKRLPRAILTPHPGEAARLLDCTVAQIQADRVAAAQALVARYEAVIVLKGAGTIVAAPNRLPRVICAGNPGMATGGMGDLLTGVIAGLLAQGMSPADAAASGALIHAQAADLVAQQGGERGLLASDLLGSIQRLVNGMSGA